MCKIFTDVFIWNHIWATHIHIWSRTRVHNQLGPSIFEEQNKIVLNLEYFFFAPDEGFYCWIVGGGVQNVWTNIFSGLLFLD